MYLLTVPLLVLIKNENGIHEALPQYMAHQVTYDLNGEPVDGCIVIEGEEVSSEIVTNKALNT